VFHSKANLTVNLNKSEFSQATVDYLGHTVGQGQVKPIMAKVPFIKSDLLFLKVC
jgi:hypothetical protein